METLKAMASNAAALWIKTSETDNSLADACAMYGYDCGFQAGYKAAAPQWISVKDRLPEEHKSVLGIVYDEIRLGYIELVSTDPGQFHWSDPGMYIDKGHYALTYWQELPEPPKEEE